MAVERSVKQEDLLRHLLNTKKCATKDEFVYSVLLGFRLFLSPRQLLTELNRLSQEDVPMASRNHFAADECPRCGRKQKNIPDVKSAKKALLEEPSTSESGPKRIVSMLFPDSSHYDEEDTLRRKRKGRKRFQNDSNPEEEENSNLEKMDCTTPSTPSSSNVTFFSKLVEIGDVRSNSALNNNSGAPFSSSRYCYKCAALSKSEVALARRKQLVHILFEWVRHFPADFRNKKILWALNDIIKSCQSENEELKRSCTNVLDCVSRLTAAQESYEHQLNEMEHSIVVKKSNKCRKTTDGMLHLVLDMTDTINVTEMAQQLCLVETDFLKHVGAEEFLQLFTADGDEDSKSNLGACVRWFNRLSHIVATVICLCRKQKQAKQVITFFSRVANRCFEMSNFNSSMAILSGLSSGPVTRLKKVWDKFELSELDKLQSVFDPSNNFLKYRSIYLSRADKLQSSPLPNRMKSSNRFSVVSQHSVASVTSTNSQHIDSGFESEHEVKMGGVFRFQETMKHFTFDPTCYPQDSVMVPFLVLLVKDVYFLNHSIETIEQDGSINFEKLNTLAHILRPLEEWKQMSSTYQKVDDIQDFLLRAPVHNDDELYLLSYKREPPTNRFEKQQLKTLKTEQAARKHDELAMAT